MTTASESLARPKQNWVIGPWSDLAFIIAAPAIALVWSVTTLQLYGTAVVYAIFTVFNVAHHMPTFIRIYGDKNLMQRFRWSLILGPIIPFGMAMALSTHMILDGQPIENMIFLFVILTIWDPWHFLMQHYGFMRIYDRHNQAPQRLAAWMDYLISASWFIYLMIAAADWLPSLLYELRLRNGVPLLNLFSGGVYPVIQQVAFGAAVAMSVVYAGYLIWCFSRGYFVSLAKVALVGITFGIMYLTYTPNSFMKSVLPQWSFTVGFATLGMVHVTQYLAIVWKYNRSLSSRADRARAGAFRELFAQGGWLVAAGYVGVCLLYGYFLSERFQEGLVVPIGGSLLGPALPWLLSIWVSLAFTSTFLHYYYDGFIWKVRHKENREALAMQEGDTKSPRSISWWESARTASAWSALARQMLYFLPPILIIVVTYMMASRDRGPAPLAQARAALQLHYEDGGGVEEAKAAIAAIDERLKVEERMSEVQPRRQHFLYIAELTYLRSRAHHEILLGQSRNATSEEKSAETRQAIAALEKALACTNGTWGHGETKSFSRKQLEQTLQQWRREIGQASV